jgi:hypothetical protein
MPSTKQLKEKLSQIDAWLASGATSVDLDGVSVKVNPEQLRIERASIERQLGSTTRKQTAYRVNLGG